jgi:hypothetical protein
MDYPETKVYFDGSHYIAIPHTEKKKKDYINERIEKWKEVAEKEGKVKRIKLKTEDINDFESLFTYWEQNKKGGKYKPESRQRMLNKLKELTNNDFEYAKKAIFYAIDNNYQGFTDGSKLYYREKPKEETFEPTPEQNAERELMLEAIRKTEELQKKRIEAKYGKI